MKRTIPFGFLLLVIVAIFLLHAAGIYLYLYWQLEPYDQFVHTLGSFWATSVVLMAVLFRAQPKKIGSIVGIALISALIIGGFWELFEFYIGGTNVSDAEFVSDTVTDVISDIIGGLLSAGYIYLWHNKKQN